MRELVGNGTELVLAKHDDGSIILCILFSHHHRSIDASIDRCFTFAFTQNFLQMTAYVTKYTSDNDPR